MYKSVHDGGADAKASKRARARHKMNFGDILPIFVVFFELVVDECKKLFGKIVTEIMMIFLVVKL